MSRAITRVPAAAALLTLAGWTPFCGAAVVQPKDPPIPSFAHVFVIVSEDHSYAEIMGSQLAPFSNKLAQQAAVATNYHAVVHPGYGDYFALTAGNDFGGPSDCTVAACSTPAVNLTDRLDARGLSWRAYMDGMTEPCQTASTSTYDAWLDIFLYFDDIRQNRQRCDRGVVPLDRLTADLSNADTAPRFVWIEPGPCNSGDSCSSCAGELGCGIAAEDSWLARAVDCILSSPAWRDSRSVLFVTWEEDWGTPENRVLMLVVGPQVREGYRSAIPYDHYSLVRTIEAAWGLQALTSNDAHAHLMSDLFKEG